MVRQRKGNMVLALRNKFCRTGTNTQLFRTWTIMTCSASSKTHNNFCLCTELRHRWGRWWYFITQKLEHVVWLLLKVRMMWNQNHDNKFEMYYYIQTIFNITLVSDILSSVMRLSSDFKILKKALKSILVACSAHNLELDFMITVEFRNIKFWCSECLAFPSRCFLNVNIYISHVYYQFC